MIHPQQFHNKF